MRYILSLDQGTTSSRALLFDHHGAVRSVAQREFKQIFPQPGWVEHDPEEIWTSQIAVAFEALAKTKAQPSDVAAIGITNQRETTIVWDRTSGKPICNAIVWQDRRTAAFCEQLKSQGHETLIQQRTGLLIDAYFSGSKISWILEHVPNARQLAEAGRLAFGTVDAWLVWKLTGGRVHVTDASNASRTMLFNLHSGRWDTDLLNLFQIPASMLPEVRPSSEVYGEVSSVPGLNGIPHRRHRRRSAGRIIWATMHQSRPHQEYLRHRLLHVAEHRQSCRDIHESFGYDRGLANRRHNRLRT